jgi:hypothetical protein
LKVKLVKADVINCVASGAESEAELSGVLSVAKIGLVLVAGVGEILEAVRRNLVESQL